MKRIFSLFLCGVLCLGLCACGNSGGYRGEHDRLLAMLDAHDYQGAVNYINELAYDHAQQNQGNVTEQYVYTAALPGEWIAYDVKEGVQVPKVSFKEDGTCTIGDKAYLWEVTDEGKTHLSVSILNGAERVYSFSLSKNTENGNVTASSSNIVKDTHLNFYNPAHYEVVELTPNNWDDYFNTVDFYTYETNAFGEVKGIFANRQWKLKQEYYSRLWYSRSDVAVEYAYHSGDQYAQWDWMVKTCTLTDVFEPDMDGDTARVYSKVQTMGSYNDSSTETEGDSYFGYRFMSANGWTSSEGATYFDGYKTDVKLTRVQGSLWLVKENIKNLQKTEA